MNFKTNCAKTLAASAASLSLLSSGCTGSAKSLSTAIPAVDNAHKSITQKTQTLAVASGSFDSTIVASHSGSCVDVPGNSNKSAIAIQQWSCNQNTQQNFSFIQSFGDDFAIKTSQGLCLDSMGMPGPATQYVCNGGLNQIWKLQIQPDGSYLIQNSGNASCLNISGNSSLDGTPIITYACDGASANERFLLAGATPSSRPSGGTLIGVAPMLNEQYHHEDGVVAFEHFLGRHVDFALEFIEDGDWRGFVSDVDYAVDGWSHLNPNRLVMWSVPLTTGPHGCGGCGTPLSDVAAGFHDAEFTHAAQAIARTQPNAMIRIGWEFNTTDYPWSATGGKQQDYINAFRHVAQIFKSASSRFTIIWCPLILQRSPDVLSEQTYPGDDLVDVIGVDYYDDTWGTPEQRWDYTVHATNGFQWQVDFAAAHGKQLSVPEWGAGRDGDRPDFIHNMAAWFRDHRYSSQSYWEGNLNSGYNSALGGNQFPNEATAYKQEFK